MKRIKVLVLAVLLMGLFQGNLFSDVYFNVSGKVIREEKGVKGAFIHISPFKYNKNSTDETIETNESGQFSTYLKSGEYKISCYAPENYSEYIEVGPEMITVKNKNIMNIMFRLYTGTEIIEANKNILNEIPPNTPTVNYSFGKIPIYSVEECKKVAEIKMTDLYDEDDVKVLTGAQIGTPVVFYDLKDNPILYQFPIVNNGIEVGFIEVDALGIKPTSDMHRLSAKPLKELTSATKATYDADIPDLIEIISKRKNCQKEDIVVLKLLCLAPNQGDNHYVMLKIIPQNEIIVTHVLTSYVSDILSDRLSLEKMQTDTEELQVFFFIKQVKEQRKTPLI